MYLLTLVIVLVISSFAYATNANAEVVSTVLQHKSLGDNLTIEISLLSTIDGGYFSTSEVQNPPAYDHVSKRLYHWSVIRDRVEVFDLSDPSHPVSLFNLSDRTKFWVNYDPIAAAEMGPPTALGMHHGVLFLLFDGKGKSTRGWMAILDRDGNALADPVRLGVQPAMLEFTPNGRQIIIPNTGEANDDYSEDPVGSVSIVTLHPSSLWGNYRGNPVIDVTEIGFENWEDKQAQLKLAGVRLYGPNNPTVAQDLEPETATVNPDSQTAYVVLQRNNALVTIDLTKKQITNIKGFGLKNHLLPGNELDVSDKDGINIQNWPIKSYYQPDWIETYRVNGRTYLVTADEGDPRDFSGYTEKIRVKDLNLDLTKFPDSTINSGLGRLNVTKEEGYYIDGNGNRVYDQLFLLGSRSLSIWTDDGKKVADTGAEFEKITSQVFPDFFNCGDDNNNFDDRSDDRGPEPEGLALGRIGNRDYAFVIFERIGGVIAYDISNPIKPKFVQYTNNRNFAVDPGKVCQKNKPKVGDCALVRDLGPESVLFIPQGESPIRDSLLILTHETSDTVSIYRIEQKPGHGFGYGHDNGDGYEHN